MTKEEDVKVDLNDQELIEAMEEFALMSQEEMEEAFAEVIDMLGNDEEAIDAMREVISKLRNMNTDVESNYETIVLGDEFVKATKASLAALAKSEWSAVHEKSDEILESIIESGKVSAEDAAVFINDSDAWEQELREIWDELQKQAKLSEL